MTHPTDDEIICIAMKHGLQRCEERERKAVIPFARALLAEQARTEPKAFTDDELRAEVKLRIERSGQTQEGYAKAHGYSPQYLSDFLTGKRLPGDKILQGEGLQAQTLYLDSMAVRVGVTGHNRFATRGDAGNLACKKCGARGLFTQIHQRPDGSDCGYLAHIVFAAQPLKAEQAKDAAEDAELLDERGDLRCDLPSPRYKVGNEFKPFHPRASHVRPEWRDGWNACFVAAIKAQGEAK